MEDCAAVRTALFEAVLCELAVEELALLPAARTLVVTARDTTLLLSAVPVFAAEAALDDRDSCAGGVDAAETVGTLLTDPALVEPAASAEVCEPLAVPPDVLIQICFSMDGRCQYCGATSMTT